MLRNNKGQFKKGGKHTEEWKRKKAEEMKGNKRWDNPVCKKNQFTKGHAYLGAEGEKHHRWGGGGRNSKAWKTWRGLVLKKAGNKCETCGESKKQLVAHHIKAWRKYPKIKFSVSNGMALCRKCHPLQHPELISNLQ